MNKVCDQGLDAGNVLDGGDRRAAVHEGLCGWQRHSVSAGDSTTKDKKKGDKSSSIEDPKFLAGYRTAYTTIYDRHDYATAIEQLKALGQDDRADVANLIGYSYRKLGDYKLSQVYYERALAGRSRSTSAPGSITVCGSSSRAIVSRPSIT